MLIAQIENRPGRFFDLNKIIYNFQAVKTSDFILAQKGPFSQQGARLIINAYRRYLPQSPVECDLALIIPALFLNSLYVKEDN